MVNGERPSSPLPLRRPPKFIAGLVWVVKRVRHMIEAASDITVVFIDHSAWYNGFLLFSSGVAPPTVRVKVCGLR